MNPPSSDPHSAIPEAIRDALSQRAAPLFEEAAHYARENGIDAQVHLQLDAAEPELTLMLGNGAGYHIRSNNLQDRLLINHSHGSVAAPAQEVSVTAINPTVIETDLAAFFMRAVGLRLEYVAARHPAGF